MLQPRLLALVASLILVLGADAASQAGAPRVQQTPLQRAQALMDSGDIDEALALYTQLSGGFRFAGPAAVGAAQACVRLERNDEAFTWLTRAVQNGWGDRAMLASDEDLQLLAEDPRFASVLPPLVEGDDAFAEDVRVIHVWNGEAGGDQYGWVTRRTGDLDGDGACDFASTAPSANGGRGRAYVVSSKSGKELFRFDGAAAGAQLGNSVSGEIDIDADGTPDVIVGAPGSGRLAGRAYALSGKTGKVIHDLSEETPADQFGMKVSGIEDLDGDGHAEICVGASGLGAGKVVVFSGKTGEKMYEFTGENVGDQFGQSLDGSRSGGHRMLAVGAPTAGASKHGRVYVYRLDGKGAELGFVIDTDETGNNLGQYFVTLFGDVDGDGVPDVYASDFNNAARGPSTGRVFVHSGKTGKRLLTITGHAPGQGFGTTAAVCGDANGDGAADLIIGAWQEGGVANSAGACYLHSGKDGSLLAQWSCTQAYDTLGFDAVGLGDVDGDGSDDFLMSSAWAIVERGRQGRVFLVAGPRLR